MPMPVMSAGDSTVHIHMDGAFPNATNAEEIEKAMEKVIANYQRKQYKAAQQPGFGQGFLR
jgi:superfamily I DNA and RNA helicase